MIRALRDGRKTVARVILKELPNHDMQPCLVKGVWHYTNAARDFYKPLNIPYAPGQRIWVQERWRAPAAFNEVEASLIRTNTNRRWCPVIYCADGAMNDADAWLDASGATVEPGKDRGPATMPRWASRMTLEITSVHLQRLKDITDSDAFFEGMVRHRLGDIRDRLPENSPLTALSDASFFYFPTDENCAEASTRPRQAYRAFWKAIEPGSGDRSYRWRSNPWVIRLAFDVTLANIDDRREAA